MRHEPVRDISSVAVPLLRDNIDTDQIIPSREMKSVSREGLADGLFAGWRYIDPDSRERVADFPLNLEPYRGAQILLGGANFGCGSSREHAVWALREYGFRVIIAESFGEIFHNNCLRNGVLPVALRGEQVRRIAAAMPAQVCVDLPSQRIELPSGERYPFKIDPFAKRMLTEGSDPIELTLTAAPDIEAWLEADRLRRPWLYGSGLTVSRSS